MSSKTAGATSLGMQSENFGYSRVRLRRIKKLQFGVVNPNELVGTLCISYDDFTGSGTMRIMTVTFFALPGSAKCLLTPRPYLVLLHRTLASVLCHTSHHGQRTQNTRGGNAI